MSGIVFFGTNMLEQLREFYTKKVGCSIWLEQADCIVLKHNNMLFGFCRREQEEICGILCFFFETQNEVDAYYNTFNESADSPPVLNEKYNIYHFFARDPEGRKIEFQAFLDKMTI